MGNPDVVQKQSRNAVLQTSINISGIMYALHSLTILHLAIITFTEAAYPFLLAYYLGMQHAQHFSIFRTKKTHSSSLNSRAKSRWAKELFLCKSTRVSIGNKGVEDVKEFKWGQEEISGMKRESPDEELSGVNICFQPLWTQEDSLQI